MKKRPGLAHFLKTGPDPIQNISSVKFSYDCLKHSE